MIYITGDTHGEFKYRFNTENFPEQREMTKDDYVIICGDFGGVWDVGWEQELANEEEMQEGSDNLRAHDYTVDFIVTHCCSTSTQIILDEAIYTPDRETDYLEFIKNYANYKKWFFGHYHDNRNVSDKEILIYEQMIRIS